MGFLSNLIHKPLYNFSVTCRLPRPELDSFNWEEHVLIEERVFTLQEILKELGGIRGFDNFKSAAIKQRLNVLNEDATYLTPEQRNTTMRRGMQVLINITGNPQSMRILSDELERFGVKEGYRFINPLYLTNKDEIGRKIPDVDLSKFPDKAAEYKKLNSVLGDETIGSIFPLMVKYNAWARCESDIRLYLGVFNDIPKSIFHHIGFTSLRSRDLNVYWEDWVWDNPAINQNDPVVLELLKKIQLAAAKVMLSQIVQRNVSSSHDAEILLNAIKDKTTIDLNVDFPNSATFLKLVKPYSEILTDDDFPEDLRCQKHGNGVIYNGFIFSPTRL